MKRSKFSLSNTKLLSMSQGWLFPVGLTEVLPGDTIQQVTSALIRTQPLMAPVMHPVHVRIHHWFVPHRLVWNASATDSWESFITGGPDGTSPAVFPQINFPAPPGLGTLADCYGIPGDLQPGVQVSALPFRGYAKIWNEWYRDQDLQTALTIDLTGGSDTTTNVAMQRVAWEKDRFTTARPWTQKGPEVTVPLGARADVKGIGIANWGSAPSASVPVHESGTPGSAVYTSAFAVDQAAAGGADTLAQMWVDNDPSTYPNIYADLSTASAANINELREAFAIQRYQEARARYGSRYTEYLRYLGVRSSDARLQRPEYLGGGKQTIQFSEVLQTGVTTDGDDEEGVGNLKGHGIGALRSNRYRRFFEEHGYIHTFMSVKPKTIYGQGIAKTWLRSTKEDFFQKELQHIGQEEVMAVELKADYADPSFVFGWQDRYDDYRRAESTIAGDFRDTLDFWHMARIFGTDPTLNAAFIAADPTTRIYQVPANHGLFIMVNHSIQARRIVAPQGNSYIY